MATCLVQLLLSVLFQNKTHSLEHALKERKTVLHFPAVEKYVPQGRGSNLCECLLLVRELPAPL
jgi:hypothetical protein